jgi:hypothetical protein
MHSTLLGIKGKGRQGNMQVFGVFLLHRQRSADV